MIIITQTQEVKQYNIPGVGITLLKNLQEVKKDSKLGQAIIKYFPGVYAEKKEEQLLVEEPVQEAKVVVEKEPVQEEQEQDVKDLSKFKRKDELKAYGKDLGVDLDSTKSMKVMYKELLGKLAK